MLMKALKTFRRGDTGETVRTGHEFEVNSTVARSYEQRGMAVPVRGDMVPARRGGVENKAAVTGPLPSAGGKTGAEMPASLSPAGQAPERPESSGLEVGAGSLPSTSPGASSLSPKSSTPATERGGKQKKDSPNSLV